MSCAALAHHWGTRWLRFPAFGIVLALLVGIAGADFGGSEEKLTSAVVLTPRKSKAHLDLVDWHLFWKDTDKAESTLQNALEVDPEHAWRYHQRLGDVQYDFRHDLNASEASYREALRRKPLARRSLLRYGALRSWQGAKEEADTLFADAAKDGLLRDARQRPLEEFLAELPSELGPWIPASNYMLLDDAMENLAHPQVLEEFQKEYTQWASSLKNKDSLVSLESDPKAPGRHLQFPIHNPHFHEGVWKDMCAMETPKICQALKSLNQSGLVTIIRASFQILENGARVRPHCHTTNAELFVDVTLQAPEPSELGGFVFTSANGEQRPWVEGDVSILDGSFEHMHGNSAIGKPAVSLRLVVQHPQLPCSGSWEDCGARGFFTYVWRHLWRIIKGTKDDFGVEDEQDDEL